MHASGNYIVEGDCYDDDDDDDDYEDDYYYEDGEADPLAPVGAAGDAVRLRQQERFRATLPTPGGDRLPADGGTIWSQQQQEQRVTKAQLELREAIRNRSCQPALLLDRLQAGDGLDLNAPLKFGWTPLMLASEGCHVEMVRALIERGARADRSSADGTTCLMAACAGVIGDGATQHREESAVLEIVQLLMECGAADTVNAVSARQGTALHLAVRFNYPQVVARFLASGAGVDIPSAGPDGRTPLMDAAARGNLRAVEALLAGGAKPDRRDRRGHTASELAANAGYARVARLIDSPIGELPSALADIDGDDPTPKCKGAVAVVDEESAKLDDLSSFFYGIGYPEVANQFRAHSLTFVDLLTTTDSALERIGVLQLGVRRRILEAVRQLHRRPWRESSMPQAASGRPPTATDYLAILANLHKHLEFMNATLKYLTDHAEAAAADAAADAAAAAAGAVLSATAAASADGPADGLRNQRILARARNSCRLAAEECRRMLSRLDAGLAALQALKPIEQPDRLPAASLPTPGNNLKSALYKTSLGVGALAAGGILVWSVSRLLYKQKM